MIPIVQCEHHLLPFYGMAHVAYLPSDDGGQHRLTVAQLEAVVAMYSKRLQIQVRGRCSPAGLVQHCPASARSCYPP